jgi:hypothetical protein
MKEKTYDAMKTALYHLEDAGILTARVSDNELSAKARKLAREAVAQAKAAS